MRGIFIIGLALLTPVPLLADDTANQLTLADLVAYRAALSGKATAADARAGDPPISASFRDLWDRPESFRGRRVTIRGRVERVFRQGAVGRFPALVQAWAFSPSGDPFCLAYPGPEKPGGPAEGMAAAAGPPLGVDIQFTGTFLKVVEYPAGDGPRLAPMIVGDGPPVPAKPKAAAPHRAGSDPGAPAADWVVGLIAAAAVVGVLAARHLRSGAPPRRGRAEADPPLEFLSPGPEGERRGPS